MKASLKSPIRKTSVIMAVPMALALAGCQGTLHTRWAEQADSYDHWSPAMAHIPVDVHGAIPGISTEATAARIPQGTTATDYASRHPSSLGLEARPRLVMYIGGDLMPTNASYCSSAPVMHPVPAVRDKVMVASALCDGPRLVVRSRREVDASELSESAIASTLESVKSKLLFGLQVSRAQQPTEENG